MKSYLYFLFSLFLPFMTFIDSKAQVGSEKNPSGNLNPEDYLEKVLLVRDPMVVDNPLRTGLNPIENIEILSGKKVLVKTKFPHGRKSGDSVVLDGVQGISIPGVSNWNFLAEKIDDKSFILCNFTATSSPNKFAVGEGVYTPSEDDYLLGCWTFGHLVGNMMGKDEVPGKFLEHWFSQWTEEQMVNGHKSDKRESPGTSPEINWPRNQKGELSLAKSPLRLLSIVNRMDLWKQNEDTGQPLDAGEGRFVFCLTNGYQSAENEDGYVRNSESFGLGFTIIFEYGLDASSDNQLKKWVDRWHGLARTISRLDPKINENYLNALEEVTDRITQRGTSPSKPNGNSINQIRTNEIVLGNPWQMREFSLQSKNVLVESFRGKTKLTAPAGQLKNTDEIGIWTTTTKGNPDFDKFSNSQFLSSWLNKRKAIILGDHTWQAPAWTVGPIANEPNPSSTFKFPTLKNEQIAKQFGLMTCTGCHTGNTGTTFTMIEPRADSQASNLANFLKNEDLVARKVIMDELVDHFELRKSNITVMGSSMVVVISGSIGDSLLSAPQHSPLQPVQTPSLPKPRRQNRVH